MTRNRIGVGRVAVLGLAMALSTACQAAPAAGDASASAPIASGSPVAIDASATPAVISAKVDVGGHKLSYACSGEGSPTVILEHGLGGDMQQWAGVLRAISSRTKVCTYDRANARESDTVAGTRTVADSVADLHTLLGRAGIDGPLVLVGFSWGGLVDQLYARTYPTEIAGMVLVDSNSAEEARTYYAHLTPALVAADKQEIAGPNPENVDLLGSFEIVRRSPAMPDVPLVVVSRTVEDPNEWPSGWDPTVFNGLQADLQADLVKLTSKGTQVHAAGAGHDIPHENPDAITAAIASVLDQVAAR